MKPTPDLHLKPINPLSEGWGPPHYFKHRITNATGEGINSKIQPDGKTHGMRIPEPAALQDRDLLPLRWSRPQPPTGGPVNSAPQDLGGTHNKARSATYKPQGTVQTTPTTSHHNDGRVVSNFIMQALKGEPITLFGTGTQTHSFCYVDDLVTGMIATMDQDEIVWTVNLGNPGEFTILELATMVKELTGSKSEIVFRPLPQDDPVRRRPDIILAKEKLG